MGDKELSESNKILQDCYNGHLAHFQYTSLSRLKKKFFHSTLILTANTVATANKTSPPKAYKCQHCGIIFLDVIVSMTTATTIVSTIRQKPQSSAETNSTRYTSISLTGKFDQ